jgi:hypothetical protein
MEFLIYLTVPLFVTALWVLLGRRWVGGVVPPWWKDPRTWQTLITSCVVSIALFAKNYFLK